MKANNKKETRTEKNIFIISIWICFSDGLFVKILIALYFQEVGWDLRMWMTSG